MSASWTQTGTVVSAEFSRGTPSITTECEDCGCPEHDYERENPTPAGTYITVRLDDDSARVGLMRVVVTQIEGATK